MIPYIGLIAMLGFNFAPQGWKLCNGQLLSIADYEVLFVLIGTTYGGDGVQTFAVPDLRGRAVIGQGTGPGLSGKILGQMAGNENHIITLNEIPTHGTMPATSAVGTTANPIGNIPATSSKIGSGPNASTLNLYAPYGTLPAVPLAGTPVGGNQAMKLMQPYLSVNYSIATIGIFPSRN